MSDSGEFATRIVDGLLDTLTGNEHSKANKIFEEVTVQNHLLNAETIIYLTSNVVC